VKFALNLAEARNAILDEAEGTGSGSSMMTRVRKRFVAASAAVAKSVVAPVVLTRSIPSAPCTWAGPTHRTKHYRYALTMDDPIGLKEVTRRVPQGCWCGGRSGRRFRHRGLRWGSWIDGLSEDVSFCRRVREAGFDIHVDLSTPMEHLVVASVRPERQPDGSG